MRSDDGPAGRRNTTFAVMYFDGSSNIDLFGPAFLLNAIGAIAGAVLALMSERRKA